MLTHVSSCNEWFWDNADSSSIRPEMSVDCIVARKFTRFLSSFVWCAAEPFDRPLQRFKSIEFCEFFVLNVLVVFQYCKAIVYGVRGKFNLSRDFDAVSPLLISFWNDVLLILHNSLSWRRMASRWLIAGIVRTKLESFLRLWCRNDRHCATWLKTFGGARFLGSKWSALCSF